MKQGVYTLFAGCVLSALSAYAGAQPVRYTMSLIGTLGGGGRISAAYGINDAGQMVGGSSTATDPNTHAFISDGSVMQDLGIPAGWATSYARAVNSLGIAAGAIGGSTFHAAIFPGPGKAPQDLGALAGNYSDARGINSSGDVVGDYKIAPFVTRAFVYSNGTMTDLGLPAGYSSGYARAINDAGQIVGYYKKANGLPYTFVRSSSDGQMTVFDKPDDPVNSAAVAINQEGQFAGNAHFQSNAPLHAFLYSEGEFHDLGIGTAAAMNDHGEVVGNSAQRGFIYTGSTGRFDLNSLIDNLGDKTFMEATGINNSGQILGLVNADSPSGPPLAVLLTPVPESSALHGLFWVAIYVVAKLRPRRHRRD